MKMILTACLSLCLLGSTGVLAQAEPELSVEPAEFSDQELDQMLAPVALYPDTVLAHILIAATYPLEVVQAARWTEQNVGLEGDSAVQAVENEDWDPSVKALVAFPEILQRMSEELDWTERLGNAFLDDEARLTGRIQFLRQRARQEGNLEDLEHLDVVEEDEKIIIEPAVREVVYVPYYDTRYVYGNWWWHDHQPVYWTHPHHYHGSHYFTHFYWGPRIRISTGFFFSGFHWDNHHLVILDRHHHYRRHYYTGRQIVRHRDSRRWHHNPRHRRGVDYYNPRTRDYFESRKRNNTVNASYQQQNRRADANSRTSVDRGPKGLRYDTSRRNAGYVRDRLNTGNPKARSERSIKTQAGPAQRTARTAKQNPTSTRDSRRQTNNVQTTRTQQRQIKGESRNQRSSVKLQSKREVRNSNPVRRVEQPARVERSKRQYQSATTPTATTKKVQRAKRVDSGKAQRSSSRQSSGVKPRSSKRDNSRVLRTNSRRER